MTRANPPPVQGSMFGDFEAAAFEEKTADMPAELEAALPYFRSLVERFHAAVLASDIDAVHRLEDDAKSLAIKLNGGTHFGMKAYEDSPCNVLERETAAPIGDIPLWGQAGEFTLNVRGCDIRIEIDSLYGICAPSFTANAVDWSKPFISPTGYRSFLGHGWTAGCAVDVHVRAEIEGHIDHELKKGLVRIEPRYRAIHNAIEAEERLEVPPP
jgi:hypothetical protein